MIFVKTDQDILPIALSRSEDRKLLVPLASRTVKEDDLAVSSQHREVVLAPRGLGWIGQRKIAACYVIGPNSDRSRNA